MGKYSGTNDELKSVVQNFGLSGSWAETPNSAYKFTSSDGKRARLMRIVTDESSEMWFTPDHYKSFIPIK